MQKHVLKKVKSNLLWTSAIFLPFTCVMTCNQPQKLKTFGKNFFWRGFYESGHWKKILFSQDGFLARIGNSYCRSSVGHFLDVPSNRQALIIHMDSIAVQIAD